MHVSSSESHDSASLLRRFIAAHPRLCVLTGAGISTSAGIPDYRDEHGEWKHARPVEFQPFMTEPAVRRRYWARSMLGWSFFSRARPTAAHFALAKLEQRGGVPLLTTQNVDGLHHVAGSRNVIDLHGRLDHVRCMQCAHQLPRAELQQQLQALNPAWVGLAAPALRPDGDVDMERDTSTFVVPECPACGGILKPDVVFFGEQVPRERVERTFEGVAQADALLVVGSSLMVYSGFRFAQAAATAGKPIAAVNLGRTRADHLLALKISAPADQVLGEALRD
ncbi:MAG: NAD-dependent protein deacetylase [Pseudomonadota bacterium]